MIRSMYCPKQGSVRFDLTHEEMAAAFKQAEGLLWVDFQAHSDQEAETILLDIFGFHPLAVDDALQETHVPKVDDWSDYLYIVLHAATFTTQPIVRLETQELDVFLGANYMVTHHDQPLAPIDTLWNVIQRDDRQLRNGVDHLLYRLTDEVVTSYMPVIDAIDDAIDQAEMQIFRRATSETLARIFSLKRVVLQMRRTLGPQREVLNKLARDDYAVIDEREQVYFRDVYDHLVRFHDIAEGIRDLVSGTLDTYLSVINNRMNEIMKTLTIITTLFMPLSFIASFFGMNFFIPRQPLTQWMEIPVFFIALLVMIIVPFLMYFWMRRRGWM